MTDAVVTLLRATGPVALSPHVQAFPIHKGTLQVSKAFLRLWCKNEWPTDSLVAELAEQGLEIVLAVAGWEVRPIVAPLVAGQTELPL